MNPMRFIRPPEMGTVLLLRGQRYELTGREHHQRIDGQATWVLHWASRCDECGATFAVTSPLVIRYLNRRCALHHRPGRPVPTARVINTWERKHG